MSATSSPFGLRPAYHPSGILRPTAMTIGTGYNANLLQFQPVLIDADGTVKAAAAGGSFVGTFMGVEFSDADGRRRVSNKWTASTAATEIVAYITMDPAIVYEVQATSSVNITNIGNQADLSNVTAGSTVTGLSEATLDASSLANTGTLQLRVLAIAPEVGNVAGDAYTIVQVQISEHQLVADKAAF
jgi:hypothetical protein